MPGPDAVPGAAGHRGIAGAPQGGRPRPEAAAFFCTSCDALLHSVEFVVDVPQRAYWDVVVAFNSTVDHRTCTTCGVVADPVDLSDIAWDDVADVLTA